MHLTVFEAPISKTAHQHWHDHITRKRRHLAQAYDELYLKANILQRGTFESRKTLRTTKQPTLSSASDPSKLKTAYLFFSFLPSSFDAGKIIAKYGPSTSKNIEFSLCTSYCNFSGSFSS